MSFFQQAVGVVYFEDRIGDFEVALELGPTEFRNEIVEVMTGCLVLCWVYSSKARHDRGPREGHRFWAGDPTMMDNLVTWVRVQSIPHRSLETIVRVIPTAKKAPVRTPNDVRWATLADAMRKVCRYSRSLHVVQTIRG